MVKPLLIAIAADGKGCGKDEIGKRLRNHHDYSILKFATPLKKALSEIFHVPISYWEYDRETPQDLLRGKTKRFVMQDIGAHFRNTYGDDFWVREVDRLYGDFFSLDYYKRIGVRSVFTDLRYPNEANYVRRKGGYIWYVSNPRVVADDPHESESHSEYLKSIADEWLVNDRGIDELHAVVDSRLGKLLSSLR